MELLENFVRREVYNEEQMLEAWALDPLRLMIEEEEEFEEVCYGI